MSDFILRERAYFWPADINVSRKVFAPDDITFGTITIKNNGQCHVALDGLLGGERSSLFKPNRSCSVAGRIFKDGRYLLMPDAWNKDHTYRTNNIDHEDFESLYTIVGSDHIEDLKKSVEDVPCILLSLGNFEDWLLEEPIETKRTKSRISVSYKISPPTSFIIGEDKARLIFEMHGPWLGRARLRSIKIEQKSRIEIYPAQKSNFLKVTKLHRQFQDLLVLLTNQEVNLDWPQIKIKRKTGRATVYYWKEDNYTADLEQHKIWINYGAIEKNFSAVLENWVQHSDNIKAGFYLYLSTRRGLFSYVENRFMSLVGGMEALHRRSNRERSCRKSNARASQVLKIVSESNKSNSKTRRWLRQKLKHAQEPSLSERIYDLTTDLPIKFEERALRDFVRLVGEARNDLAHFGSIVRAFNTEDMHGKLAQISNALDIIYHARILLEIGVAEEEILFVFDRSHRKSLLIRTLSAANVFIKSDNQINSR